MLENAEKFLIDSFGLPAGPHDMNTNQFRLTKSRRKREDLQKLVRRLGEEAAVYGT